jgi:hypothetical protein
MNNLLIINKENSKHLARPTLEKWIVEVSYRKPRKSKKGYVGSKYIREERKEFLPDYEANAIELFEQYKNKYEKLLESKKIVAGYVNCTPIIKYYVTCPKCGKDAEIITFLMMFCSDDGESMIIACKHCSNGNWDWFNNKVGRCYDTSFFINKEELNWQKEINVNQIKWENWIKKINLG